MAAPACWPRPGGDHRLSCSLKTGHHKRPQLLAGLLEAALRRASPPPEVWSTGGLTTSSAADASLTDRTPGRF